MRSLILSSVEKSISQMNLLDFSLTLHRYVVDLLSFFLLFCFVTPSFLSFGKLGLLWNVNLSRSLEEAILKQASLLLSNSHSGDNINCLSSIVEGLMRLEYDWNNNGKLEKAIYRGIASLNPTIVRKRDHVTYGKQVIECLFSLGEIAKQNKKEDSAVNVPEEVIYSFCDGIHHCSTSLVFEDAVRALSG
jgi:hypothetical protein